MFSKWDAWLGSDRLPIPRHHFPLPYNQEGVTTKAAWLAARAIEFQRGEAGMPIQGKGDAPITITCAACSEDRGWSMGKANRLCRCEKKIQRDAYSYVLGKGFGQKVIARQWGEVGIPKRHIGSTFDNFEERDGAGQAYTACKRYAEAFSEGTETGLMLMGPYGSGKTHLAVATARAVLERVLPTVRFTSAVELPAKVKQANFDYSTVEEAIGADLLVLDDLGQEHPTDFNRDLLYRVVDGRYQRNLPTIITSNQGDAQLRDQFGGALISRLYEMVRPMKVDASDYRKRLVPAA